MRAPVLLGGVEFRRGGAGVRQEEIRVVAKTAQATWHVEDFAVPFAFSDDRLRVVGAAHEDQEADEVRLAFSHLREGGEVGEQLLVVARVGFRFAGIAGGKDTGGAAERPDAQAGIVGERRQAAVLGGVAGLGERVLGEGAVRFLGFRDAKLALRDDFEAERREQRVQLLHLLGVVRGEDELLHAASAFCCSATSWRMPICARSISTFICSRVKGSPSAVPCTSTMPPWPVMMTFMSVSQLASSG
ncbi:hypothetical protein SDC9_173477 [bioreactor metagenome]|uniref:Uncharacterized protein n=1 Tax=bioreactor metagenome TaxID=1076179 RepID=A0A645GH91_9ZZZZ